MDGGIKELSKGVSTLGVARLIEFSIGLLKVKAIALLLGVTGTGIYNQLTTLTDKLAQFVLMSTPEGVVKQISNGRNESYARQLVADILRTYVTILSAIFSCTLLALGFFKDELTILVFGDISHTSATYVAIVLLPLLLVNSIPYSIFRAFKDVKRIALVRSIAAVSGLIYLLPLAYLHGLTGAFLALFLSYLTMVLCALFFLFKCYQEVLDVRWFGIPRGVVRPKIRSELLSFATFGTLVGTYLIATEFITRYMLINAEGIDAIGLYAPVLMLGTLFTGFVVPSITTYLYSMFAESGEKHISRLINDGLRLSSLLLTVYVIWAITFGGLFVEILFSDEFSDGTKYIPLHVIGIAFQVWFSVISTSFTATGRIRVHGVFRTMYFTLDIITTYLLVGRYGLDGWVYRYIISPCIFFFVYAIYTIRYMHFKVDTRNIVLIVVVMSLVCVSYFNSYVFEGNWIALAFISIALTSLIYFLLTVEEKRILLSKLGLITRLLK